MEAVNNPQPAKVDMSPILSRLRTARKNAGLSQGQVARMIGLADASGFAPIEKGEYPLTLERFLLLCSFYDIDPTWALTGVNPYVDVEALRNLASKSRAASEDIESLVELLGSMRQERKL